MSGPNDHIDSSTSGYLTSGYEGLDTRFGDFSGHSEIWSFDEPYCLLFVKHS